MKEISVKARGGGFKQALVSDEDFDRVSSLTWHEKTGGYARNTVHLGKLNGRQKLRHVTMHRFIMGAGKGQIVDHINGNKLDNRRENLRFCTKSQNNAHGINLYKNSTSGLRGVHFHKRDRVWSTKIQVNKLPIHLGYFDTKEEAYATYVAASQLYFGEFSPYAVKNSMSGTSIMFDPQHETVNS